MAIAISHLNLSIADKSICENLNVVINPGESWAILGVNGVGKTTLLHQLINVDSPLSEHVAINGKKLNQYKKDRKALARRVGLLMQDYEYNFPCTVFEAALIGRHPFSSPWQWQGKDDRKIVEQALSQTNILHLKDRYIDTLSGGEKRRLNLAMLLTQNPDYFLLDEPTNHLDLKAQVAVLDLIEVQVKEFNKSAIMVIHDANLANRYCDKVLMLFGDGQWQAGRSQELINDSNLERLYGCRINSFSDQHRTVYFPE